MINFYSKLTEKYDKFYIQDFINDFENEIKGKIFETDEEANIYMSYEDILSLKKDTNK